MNVENYVRRNLDDNNKLSSLSEYIQSSTGLSNTTPKESKYEYLLYLSVS